MRKRIILFVLPVIAFLIMATALVLTPAFSSHAAGTSHHHSKPSHTISAPAASSISGGMQPDGFFSR